MSFSKLLQPRAEILSGEGIDGIIDLANIDNRRKLESNPNRFFSLTYPTADVKRVVQTLSDRFKGSKDAAGLFLFEGLKGSGKSHLLLLIYHLFKNPKQAKKWLDAHKMYCELPEGTEVVVNKFTDLPLFSLWDFIFKQLTGTAPETGIVQPGLEDMKKVIGNRQLILILDELEQGIRVISDSARKAQNIAFLQMLSEWANRSDNVTVFASVYSDQQEPGSTLKRVPSCRVQFAHSADKAKVVLHRLFENYLDFKYDLCAPVVDSYINTWGKQSLMSPDEYRSKMLLTYPFLPDVLELILERVPARGGFQSVRGALGFLANMVRLSHDKANFITTGHANLYDREVAIRLSDLDLSGDLISRAIGNLVELKDQPLASEIGASVMLYTLTSTGHGRGATREELIRNVIAPGVDINDFERTIIAFQKYASHFWVEEGRYFFDIEENPDAKVELRSLTIDPDGTKARDLLHMLWRDEIFRESNSVVYKGEQETKDVLDQLDNNYLRYVLAPRKLIQKERHEFYRGIPTRNQVILLEPRDQKFDLDNHRDLLKWAQRQLAAQELAGSAQDSGRRSTYERIGREDKGHCMDTIKRAGLIYIHWENYGSSAKDDQVEKENVPGTTKEDVRNYLSQQLFPTQLFEEHLSSRLADLLNLSIKDIHKQYCSTLGFPVPTTVSSVSQAIRGLCLKSQIGIRHPRGNFCHENPGLTETELFDAKVGEPFETTHRPPIFTPTGEDEEISPPISGEETTIIIPPTAVPEKREEIGIPPQTGPGELRQTIAARLQEFPDPKIIQIRTTIFLEKSTGDLTSLPASIRGNLSGEGALTAEIAITKNGEFSKGEVEQIIESLPSIQGADYSARLDLIFESPPKETDNE